MQEDKIEMGDTITAKHLRDFPFNIETQLSWATKRVIRDWIDKEMTVVGINTSLSGDSMFAVAENGYLWHETWVNRLETTETNEDKNTKETKMTEPEIKMRKTMKELSEKSARGIQMTEAEYNLVEIAAKRLLGRIAIFSPNSWDIKFHDALAQIEDKDGYIIPKYYFQLAACNMNDYSQYSWIGKEIGNLTVDRVDSDQTIHVLFKSNNISISVDLVSQRVTMEKFIHRNNKKTKTRSVASVRVYHYNYKLEDLTILADKLIEVSY